MFLQLLIGTVAIIVTFAIHAFALDYTIQHLKRLEAIIFKEAYSIWKAASALFVALCVFCTHIVQIWLWAGLYMLLGEFDSLEAALYFSTSSFTTVGFGDIILSERWRLLSTIEAANGFLLFGWSTAFIFSVVSQLYDRDLKN